MNMRKIIAVLAAVLLLCSVVPMGAMSVSAANGDVAVDFNFDDGSNGGFERSVNENGYIVFDATTADWQNTYAYLALKSDTMYEVTFKAKANKDAVLSFKIQNDWTPAHVAEDVEVTTEWQEYELIVNSGTVNPAVVLFASGVTAANAAIYYIDDLKIVETVDPALIGKVVNADFETGDNTGWETLQSTSISADAAHDGSYGAHLIGGGSWGGMLNQAIMANPGKSYEISFWVKVNANGINFKIQDGDWTGSNLASAWYDTASNSEWAQKTFIVTPTTSSIYLNFCGAGNDSAEDAYVDTVTCLELKDPSFDGYITNGDFETGKTDSWDPVWWAGNISIVEGGHNGDYAMQVNHGMYQLVRQLVTVEPNTDYVVQCYAKNVSSMTLLAKSYPADANIAQASINGGDDWTQNSLVFNSGDCTQVYIGVMGNADGATAIVDDFFMFEKVEESNDGYIVNGTFETGALTPWNNLWGSCPKAEIVRGGMDSNFALEVVSGQWKHVRQTNIAVEANTNYKITAWAKNAQGMSLLVKDGGDSVDIVNAGIEAGDEWTEFVIEFNTGDYTSIIFSLMGNNAEAAFGTFDNIVMEKIEAVCEHDYQLTDGTFATCETEGSEVYTCTKCGDSYTEVIPAYHDGNMEYNAAVEPIDCATPGNIENYYCPGCYEYFADAYAQEIINPWYIQVTVDCVKPEGLADCADWTCEVCGNENYGSGEHDTGVPACQDGHCSKCDKDIAGYGHQNYDGPACLPGNCYYCGEAMEPVAHENGAWAPCLEGECSYGCGLTYPATEDHIDADADDYCDNCWNHLAHIDEDADGFCDVCWSEMPVVEIIYGDANGDGSVNARDAALLQQYVAGWDVTLDAASGDANGDGSVNARDAALLQQYVAGWDVTLGQG